MVFKAKKKCTFYQVCTFVMKKPLDITFHKKLYYLGVPFWEG